MAETNYGRLVEKAPAWTLADDSDLITCVGSTLERINQRAARFHDEVTRLEKTNRRIALSLASSNAALGLHAATQFIEQRVAEEDYRPRRAIPRVEPMPLAERQTRIVAEMTDIVRSGLGMVSTAFRPLEGSIGQFVQYEPIDKYNASIPATIGCAEWRRAIAEMARERKLGTRHSIPKSLSVDTTSERSSSANSVIGAASVKAQPAVSIPPAGDNAKISPSPSVASSLISDSSAAVIPPPPPDVPIRNAQPSLPPQLFPRRNVIDAGREEPPLPPKAPHQGAAPLQLPAQPPKKSIFDFESDEDNDLFATTMSSTRSNKTEASAAPTSSTVKSGGNGKEGAGLAPLEEEKRASPPTNRVQVLPQAVAADMAAAVLARQQGEQAVPSPSSSANPRPTMHRKEESVVVDRVAAEKSAPSIVPRTTANDALVKSTASTAAPSAQPAPKKAAPFRSLFDDSDSDNDLFKPITRKPMTSVAQPVKQEEEKPKSSVAEKKETPAPNKAPSVFGGETKKEATNIPKLPAKKATNEKKSIFDSDSDLDELFAVPKKGAPEEERSRTVEPQKAATVLEEKQPAPQATVEKKAPEQLVRSDLLREAKAVSVQRKEEETPERSTQKDIVQPSKGSSAVEDPLSQPLPEAPVKHATSASAPKEETLLEEEPLFQEAKQIQQPKVAKREQEEQPKQQEEPVKEPIKKVDEFVEKNAAKEPAPALTLKEERPESLSESGKKKERETVEEKDETVAADPSTSFGSTAGYNDSPIHLPPPADISPPTNEEVIAPVVVQPRRPSSPFLPFSSPPPFVAPPDSSSTSDSKEDSEEEESDMHGRAAFMEQLNAKLSAKPPFGAPPGVRPRPFSAVDIPLPVPQDVAEPRPAPTVPSPPLRSPNAPPPRSPITLRSKSVQPEEKKDAPTQLLHSITKDRPRPPSSRRPPSRRPIGASRDDSALVVEDKKAKRELNDELSSVLASVTLRSPIKNRESPWTPKSPKKSEETDVKVTDVKQSPPSPVKLRGATATRQPSTHSLKDGDDDPLGLVAASASASSPSANAKPPPHPATRTTPSNSSAHGSTATASKTIPAATPTNKQTSPSASQKTPPITRAATLNTPSAAKPPLASTRQSSVTMTPSPSNASPSASSTASGHVASSSSLSTTAAAEKKKSIFDSDSDTDNLFESITRKPASKLKSQPVSSSTSRAAPITEAAGEDATKKPHKSLFDDSDDDLALFRTK